MRCGIVIVSLIGLLQQATIEVDVRLQQLEAVVRNSSGALVRHLRAEDFRIEEDGVPQTIAHFSEDSDAPVSLGILIDVSGSMAIRSGGLSRLSAAEGTTRVLLHLMKEHDEFLLMSFSDSFRVRQEFTEDPQHIEKELDRLQPGGNTNLFGSVASALQKMKQAKHRKRALVLISDGIAQGNIKSLASIVRNGEVSIYTFALGSDTGMSPFGMPARGWMGGTAALGLPGTNEIMKTLAEESGGRSELFDVADLDTALQRMVEFVRDIAVDLRGQYSLDYYSKTPGSVIRVRMTDPQYTVLSRKNAMESPR